MLNAMLAVNNKMIIEVRRADGSIAERYLGPSDEQLKYEHDKGQCGAFCGYCYHEATEWLAHETANAGANSAALQRSPMEAEGRNES